MKYFKNNNNEIFAYDDEQVSQGYGKDLTSITQADVDSINEAKRLEVEELPATKIAEAKAYLASTDYKVLPDYDGDTTGIVEARAEARALIRELEAQGEF